MPHQADNDPSILRSRLDEEARAAGFDRIGIAPASLPSEVQDRFRAWIADGCHGDMDWMADTRERRRAPDALWPEAKSVILLAMNYGPDTDPLETPVPPDHANISVYARNRDYHDLVKKRLKRVARWLVSETGGEVKVFVDTAPVLEKPLAARSALGWQGKHTNLVSDALGSWFFIGSIFTSLEIEPDEPHADRCGSCRACLDSCPTNAFPAPYRLDARRCISYLTIEHKGHIAREFREPMGNRIYGCDDCLAVCPWNKFAQAASEAALQARDELKSPPLDKLLDLDDETFRTLFRGSPVKRIGRDRFVRNVLIAAGNSGEARLLPSVARLLDDASPLVRAMAVWALARLAPEERFLEARDAHMTAEIDADVRAEWASPPVPSDAAAPR